MIRRHFRAHHPIRRGQTVEQIVAELRLVDRQQLRSRINPLGAAPTIATRNTDAVAGPGSGHRAAQPACFVDALPNLESATATATLCGGLAAV